jgi:hypothetical protein
MVVGFPGNHFKGEIEPALRELVDSGTIRILDLALVSKSKDGSVAAMEVQDLASPLGAAFRAVHHDGGELVNERDLIEIAESLEPNSSAAVLVWEDVWAAKIVAAMGEANGVLLDLQRVPGDVVDAALDYAHSMGH